MPDISAALKCFFCGKPMALQEEPLFKCLKCACGESIFVDYRVDPKGYPGFGPTAFLPPQLKYWTEETAREWERFETYVVGAYRQMGHYSDEEADAQLAKVHAVLTRWREQRKQRGIWAAICRLFGQKAEQP